MTTHLFKHDKQYYAKSTVTGAYVRYEYNFENTSEKELYPWYVYMEKPWGSESYEGAEWESPRGHGLSYLQDDTIGGWDQGPSGRFPTKKMMTFRQLKIDSVKAHVSQLKPVNGDETTPFWMRVKKLNENHKYTKQTKKYLEIIRKM